MELAESGPFRRGGASFRRCEAELRRDRAHERVDQPTRQRDDDDCRQWTIRRGRLDGGPANDDLRAGKLRLRGHAQWSFFEVLEEVRIHFSYLRRGRKGGYWEGLQFEARGNY